MLLLIFSNSFGVSIWAGPDARRTIYVAPENRRVFVI